MSTSAHTKVMTLFSNHFVRGSLSVKTLNAQKRRKCRGRVKNAFAQMKAMNPTKTTAVRIFELQLSSALLKDVIPFIYGQ